MLLGVPCVAADVGGVSDMMTHTAEGHVYQSTAPYMLAHYIQEVFAAEEKAEEMGMAAARHAARTHDPDTNLQQLLRIYREVAV
jgi:glycosyltransferase involved in cell wall biosynthesis